MSRLQPGPAANRRPKAPGVIAVMALLAATWLAPGTAGAQAASNAPPAPAAATVPQATAIRVTTSMGAFVFELQADRAPLTVQNFLRYVSEGFYTNTLFHRVVGNFVVQGGGHDATSMKLKATHEAVVNESGNGLQNKRGTVGMARSGPPHSANAQFYVNLADNNELDPLPTRWGYTVFGRVIDGMDVVEKIGVLATGNVGPFKSEAPLKPVIIEKVEALASTPTPSAPASSTPPPPVTAPPPAPSATGAESPPQ
ncbi:MAG: peptidylprolyl isomerase [Gammaproteobacteria bacterium]